MSTTTFSALSSALIARQIARVSRPKPWLSKSTVVPSSSTTTTTVGLHGKAPTHTRRPIPNPVCSRFAKPSAVHSSTSSSPSSLVARAIARHSRDRPWLLQPIQPTAPAIVKSATTTAWIQSQAIDLRQTLRQSPPSKRLNSWLVSQAISPLRVSSSIPRSSAWGRKSSANYLRLLRTAAIPAIQPSKVQIPASSTWGRKSSANHQRLTLRQAFLSSRQASPAFGSLPQQADKLDNTIAALASTVLKRYDPKPLRDAENRLLKTMNAARHAYARLLETEYSLEDQDTQAKDPTPGPRKTVTFNDNPKVIQVPRWIGVDNHKSEHVHGDPSRFLGILRAWTPTDADPTVYHTTFSSWVDDSQFDHSDCQNPECHFRAKDLYMLDDNNQEEWTPPVWTDDSNID